MRRPVRIALVLLTIVAAQVARAQSTQLPIRYHFGDDPRWASPDFDDSSWPIAPDAGWPLPPFYSSGMVWVRMQVSATPDAGDSLALRLLGANYGGRSYASDYASEQIFLDGVALGRIGDLPPRPQAMALPSSRVYPVADHVAHVKPATLAIRLWYPPNFRYGGGHDRANAKLMSAALAGALERADQAAVVLSWIPMFVLNAFPGLAGVGLFFLWCWSRRRELLWFSLLLFFYSFDNLHFALIEFSSHPLSMRVDVAIEVAFNIVTMFTTVEFLWIVFSLRARWLRILLHCSWIVFNAALCCFPTSASPAIPLAMRTAFIALTVFNLGTLLIELRYLFFGPNRGIALGMALIPIGSALWAFEFQLDNLFGVPHLNLFVAVFLLAGFFIAVILVRRALAEWRQGNDLRVEFEAAREVQQQIVTGPPDIPGFRIQSVYAPAQHVGGDFFRVLPQPDGGAFIIVGDVSGKGLRAAMTVSAILGALSTIACESPAQFLHALNRALHGNLRGGFVTCLCTRIDPAGQLTIANAGHLAPYRNCEEIPLDPGLPLGIVADATYSETTIRLAPGDRLTILTDGVVEAQNATGELFGFDRTRIISTQSAEAIAAAAQTHGQEDDITVLTVQFQGKPRPETFSVGLKLEQLKAEG